MNKLLEVISRLVPGRWNRYSRGSGGSRPGAEDSLLDTKKKSGTSVRLDIGDEVEEDGGGGGGGGSGGGCGSGGEEQLQRRSSGVPRDVRLQREFDENKRSRPDKAFSLAATRVASSVRRSEVFAYDKSERVYQMDHCACPACGSRVAEDAAVTAAFGVRVYSQMGEYGLAIYKRRCADCWHVFTPDAADAGCYASQAGKSRGGSRWYAIELLEGVSSRLVFRGTSFTDVAEAFGSPSAPFLKAWMEYHRTSHSFHALTTLGVKGIDTGHLGGCPVCSDIDISLGPRPAATDPILKWWEDAHLRLPLKLSVMMDATNTLDTSGGVAGASDHILPVTGTFLSEALQQRLADDLAAARQKSGGDTSAADDEGDGGCAPGENYKAGRREPTQGSKKKSEGVCGACCAEGIPLRELFFSMDDTHECFLFYDYIVDAIFLRLKGVNYIFLDFGCKFGRHYYRRQAQAKGVLHIVLPAMHAEGHVKPCRLTNCGIYFDGLGYVMGEEMEQLWYLAKFWAASTRSMSRAYRIDFLNLALEWVASRKASNMFKTLTKKVRDMRAKQTTFSKTLLDLANVRLAMGKEADLAGARAWMADRCVQLTRLETGNGGGNADGAPVDFLSKYALNIVRESLTRNAQGSDSGRTYDLLFPDKGRGVRQMEKLIHGLKSSLAVAETAHFQEQHLSDLGWLKSDGGRQDLPALLRLPTFVEQLNIGKDAEISSLRTFIVVTVCELSALKVLMDQRGLRSSLNAPNKKNTRAKNGLMKRLGDLLQSLKGWEAWTVAATGLRLASAPSRPTAAEIDAVKNEHYPWASGAVLAVDDLFEGMRPMLETNRVVSAKLARVRKELRDLPVKFERVYHHLRNLRLRITQCSDEKKAAVAAIEAAIEDLQAALAAATHAAACCAGAPCVAACEKGQALTARGKKTAEVLKLKGEIEMLRAYFEQAEKDAAPFDARAAIAGCIWAPQGETADSESDAQWLPEEGDYLESDSESEESEDDDYGDFEPAGESVE